MRLEQLNVAQPMLRTGRDKLDELVASIEEVGVLVPLVVRALGGSEYAVIGGAGRLEALRRTGAGPKATVPCLVVEADDAEAMLLGLVDNVVREGMRPFDEAQAIRLLTVDYGLSQLAVARALGLFAGAGVAEAGGVSALGGRDQGAAQGGDRDGAGDGVAAARGGCGGAAADPRADEGGAAFGQAGAGARRGAAGSAKGRWSRCATR